MCGLKEVDGESEACVVSKLIKPIKMPLRRHPNNDMNRSTCFNREAVQNALWPCADKQWKGKEPIEDYFTTSNRFQSPFSHRSSWFLKEFLQPCATAHAAFIVGTTAACTADTGVGSWKNTSAGGENSHKLKSWKLKPTETDWNGEAWQPRVQRCSGRCASHEAGDDCGS